ncbi:LemA family protein [Ramlibacter rhizophilus]|uniref:LemA family protein n=1 Tax=Ramlibacter rhizophilus TaxID=1781167 RepID=A0A4Z0BD59_9BURK|nr:LemA family protein [Ramlibacter rhizophilus]TFY97236.1 LemA family protein [Ramlibacter rhizophilus]
MTRTLLGWMAVAVLVFWSVGAYNRLVRLRADARTAFSAVDAHWQQELGLIDSLLSPDEPMPDSLFPGEGRPSFWDGLRGAGLQLSAALAASRVRPLEPARIEALAAAVGVMRLAWERVEREDAHDLAGPRLPDTLAASRMQLAVQGQAAIDQFNEAVRRYNHAVAQFPAAVLAWIFGFRPARTL